MFYSMRPRPLAVRLMVSLLVLSLAGSAGGEEENEEKAWDQAAVTKLAIELSQTLRESYAERSKAPPQQTAFQQRERDAALAVVRRARDLSEDYARQMRAGSTREDSDPLFRAVVDEVAHVWDTAGDAVPPESAKPRIDRLQRILEELRAWYDAA